MIEIKEETKYSLQKYSLDDNDQFILKKGTIILEAGPIYTGTDEGQDETGIYLTVLTPISLSSKES